MIDHISIKNFAIIENAEIDFEKGLNIVTGETGSGKSILIEAISLALGSRADNSCIRTGTDKAIVQLSGSLKGEEFVITREISASGKNLCKLNGELVTLAHLNQVSGKLADIHGQYDNQSLLNPDYHIVLLDAYHTDKISPLKTQTGLDFAAYASAKSKLLSLLTSEKENARKKDFYQFEIAEIDKSNLIPGEDEALSDKISILQNSEKIYAGLENAYGLVFEQNPSAMDAIRSAVSSIEDIADFSKDFTTLYQELSDLYYRFQDLGKDLRDMRENTVFSPAELDASIARQEVISGLKKKYGSSIEEILAYRDKISQQLSLIENFDQERKLLENELLSAKNQLLKTCQQLTEIRKEVAAELEAKILKEMLDLNFNDAKISIEISPLSSPTPDGADKVEILVSTNKGEPLKPLAKVASGGEMSRIMLAFKNVLSSYDQIPTLIFDEIDNGISGITASIVGKKLKEIAQARQIICITHLPQIAACGEYQYKIFKETHDEKTFTSVEKLNDRERIIEIARLLGGTTITDTTLKSAEELLEQSRSATIINS